MGSGLTKTTKSILDNVPHTEEEKAEGKTANTDIRRVKTAKLVVQKVRAPSPPPSGPGTMVSRAPRAGAVGL